ncbi:ribonucleoside-diphosphate reductase alpha chain [Deinobacterium chartae]|uniref:Ribonucleoside-diphosphate reductase n=1 Tax=Deinobacterium chartae TaxID=521158 RepID=A0A841I4A4_9DEIO|nr:ribonucleoside-diphosphate reductase subunit alpha [Deinobacterium chartae]MBB6099856.1 ribonucleoside-diphosphate reductase alpha chain [Deinobacterium chartae]
MTLAATEMDVLLEAVLAPAELKTVLRQAAAPLLTAPMSEADLEETLLQTALDLQRDEPDYGAVARDLLLRRLRREALSQPQPDETRYRQGFLEYIRVGVERGLIDPRLQALDLEAAARALVPARDRLIPYLGLATLADRYLVRDLHENRILELPQYLMMRVALGVSLSEHEPLRWALSFYERMSTLRYLPGTPTLFNAGTPHHQLSSCYLSDVEDSLEHIMSSSADFAQLAKYAGGVGASVTKLRAMGSPVRGVNGRSSGIIPFVHMLDAQFKAIDQGGRRRGTLAVYLEPWHLEVEEFLELRRNSGDPYRRAHSIDPVLWVPDLFMRRVEADLEWTLFDPALAPELTELYGSAFDARYSELEAQAQAGKLRAGGYRTLRARELFHRILAALQETAHPWITFKDAGNLRSSNAHVGVIHSSNLCTEIFLPTDRDHIAVCNLASVNLARHLEGDRIDWAELERSVRLAVRQLDNVIDLNFYPSPRAARSNARIRPIGLGVMGFTELTQRLRLPYGSAAARTLASELFAFLNYHATDESANLAREKGSYPAFEGSTWSRGHLTADTLTDLNLERGFAAEVSPAPGALDWSGLRRKVTGGMRNSVTSAVAPTATIGLIAGTTPSLDPHYANVYARNTLSGKFLEFNAQLVTDLKRLGRWEELREALIAARGDVAALDLPEELKELYQTAFQIEPDAYLDVAARAQVYIDMGISRNLYLTTRDVNALREVYLSAWKRGLKSTYYLFVEQRMTTEQSTVAVNKRHQRARWVLEAEQQDPQVTDSAPACSLDDPSCESCQ